MKYLTIIYLFLYITHIFLGPYYIYYLLSFKKIKWVSKNLNEVIRRSTYITYITFLTIALFNENPNPETFIVSLTMSIFSTLGYYFKFYNSEYFYYGMIDHFTYLIVPTISLFFYYKLDITKYKSTIISFLTLYYLLKLKKTDHKVYSTGFDI